jgi:hypothetical protein
MFGGSHAATPRPLCAARASCARQATARRLRARPHSCALLARLARAAGANKAAGAGGLLVVVARAKGACPSYYPRDAAAHSLGVRRRWRGRAERRRAARRPRTAAQAKEAICGCAATASTCGHAYGRAAAASSRAGCAFLAFPADRWWLGRWGPKALRKACIFCKSAQRAVVLDARLGRRKRGHRHMES